MMTAMSPPTIHTAALDDIPPRLLYDLLRLRVAVFVVEQKCPYAELDGRDTERGTVHVWAEEDGRVLAYLRILVDGEAARIGRVCTAEHARGRGLAAQLMSTALQHLGDRPSRLDAQTPLRGWYERFGYSPAGAEFLEDGIPHTPMSRP